MADLSAPLPSPGLPGSPDRSVTGPSALRARIGRLHKHPSPPPALARRRRLVAYSRFSSDGQRESSIERQVELAREYAARNDMDFVGSYEDRATTGFSTRRRDALRRMLDEAGRGSFDVVFVENVDRLSRRERDAHAIMDELEYLKVELHDPSGVRRGVSFGVSAVLAAEAVRQAKARMRRGRRSAVRQGRSPHPPKFGLRLTTRRGILEPHPDRAEAVREIFRRYASGVSRASIALDLTGRHPTPGDCRDIDHGRASPGTRSPWTGAMVREVLRGTVYLGMLYDGRTVKVRDRDNEPVGVELRPEEDWDEGEAPHLRIVDDATWLAANARLALDVGRRGRGGNRYLLGEAVVCGCCGRAPRLTYRSGRASSTYSCGGPS